MRGRFTTAVPGVLLILGCLGEPTEQAPSGRAQAAPLTAAAGLESPRPAFDPPDWEDPEPPEAQALAEAVVESAWNRDKRSELQGTTSRLTMPITTLVDHTTGIEGFASRLEASSRSIEDRLAELSAEVTETEVTIRLPGSILFDFDRDEVRPDAARALGEVAAVIEAYVQRPVRIEGHTDSIGSESYNQALSERRAASVSRWLVAHGCPADRLQTRGFGESRAVADNATPEGRQRNRRVEVVIEKSG